MWINGIYSFYFVNKKVKPKKKALAEAQEKVSGLNAKLATKQRELKKAADKVEALRRELEVTTNNKLRLEA
jgi:dynein heavy chain